MSRRISATGLLVVLVVLLGTVTAPAANAAEAPRWKVAGAFLGGGTEKVFTAVSTGKVKLAVPALGLTLVSNAKECGAIGAIAGTVAGVEGRVKETELFCQAISVEGAGAVCTVEPFTTVKLGGNLGWMEEAGEAASVLLDPEAGETLTTVTIQGEECAFAGEYPIKGETAGGFFPVAESKFEDEVVFGPTTTTTHWFTPKDPTTRPTMSVAGLKSGAMTATLTGTFSIILGSSQNFGVFSG